MTRKWDFVFVAMVSAAVSLLVGITYYGIFQHSTYVSGPYFYDTALFNYIVGPYSQNLSMPTAIDMPSFYYVHISPILIPFGFLAKLLHLKEFQPLELVLLLGFCGAAAVACVIVQAYLRPLGRVPSLLLAAVFAIAFGLSGIMRSSADYPHIEVLYIPLAALALFLIFHRRWIWAWVVFVACLGVREDAGLEMACIMGAYLFLSAIAERGLPARTRDLAPFLAVALIYPAAALMAQHALLPIESNFARIYSGQPAYAHLTPALLAHRWDALIHQQPQTLITLLATLAALVARPRLIVLTGLLAAAPWFLVSVTAISETAGTLSLYYGFPFAVLPLVPFIVTAELPTPSKTGHVDHV